MKLNDFLQKVILFSGKTQVQAANEAKICPPTFNALVSEGKGNRVEKYWPSVKIALRHGMKYRTKDDIGLWLDYLSGLEQEHRDMRSPKWLLPEDLTRAHRAQVERMRAASERKRRLAQLEEDRRFNEELRKRIGAVAGFVLTDGDIEISPLKTVNDFYCEGSALPTACSQWATTSERTA